MSDTSLQNMLLDDKIKGLSFFEISEKHGIPVDEVRQMYVEAMSENVVPDPIEMRQLVQLRLERLTQNLWDGIEKGSFKHVEAAIKIIERIAELMDLNEQTIKHQVTLVSDEETLQLFAVLKANNNHLYQQVRGLPLNQKALEQLEEWPMWAAEASTGAVEEVIIDAEVVNVGATGLAKKFADN